MAVLDWVRVAARETTIRSLIVATVASMLAACGPQKPAGAPAERPVIRGDASLVFFDADVFDLNFADELNHGTDRIHVNFGSPTSLNSFPARMNVWLAEVKTTAGTITVVDPSHSTASRGLFGIGMIFDLIDAINTMEARQAHARRMALADAYNAQILYDSVNGMAREVLFTRRPTAVASPAGSMPRPSPTSISDTP